MMCSSTHLLRLLLSSHAQGETDSAHRGKKITETSLTFALPPLVRTIRSWRFVRRQYMIKIYSLITHFIQKINIILSSCLQKIFSFNSIFHQFIIFFIQQSSCVTSQFILFISYIIRDTLYETEKYVLVQQHKHHKRFFKACVLLFFSSRYSTTVPGVRVLESSFHVEAHGRQPLPFPFCSASYCRRGVLLVSME